MLSNCSQFFLSGMISQIEIVLFDLLGMGFKLDCRDL